jgi:hypothetical protein
MKHDRVIRVATLNNFNFTAAEVLQVKELKSKYANVFVNSHAKTRLQDIGVPIVSTLNPDVLNVLPLRGKTSAVAVVRVKYVHSATGRAALEKCFKYCADHSLTPLITLFRMKSRKTRDSFVDEASQSHYSWSHNFFRLTPTGKRSAIRHLHARARAWGLDVKFCDKKGKGCPSCGNCSKLTFGQDLPVYEINLSSSGHCPHNCPDCFAKMLVTKNCGRIAFDKVKANSKMKGKIS